MKEGRKEGRNASTNNGIKMNVGSHEMKQEGHNDYVRSNNFAC